MIKKPLALRYVRKLTNSQEGDKLRKCNKQEKQIKEKLELIVKHYWDKGEDRVLLVIQLVS